MGRFIVLEVPAICVKCGKLIRGGRIALWTAGSFTCYTCAKKGRGEAPESVEEKQLKAALLDNDGE
jgi:hypothetical protein